MDRTLRKISTATRREMESFARQNQCDVGGDAEDLSCFCAISSFFHAMVAKHFGYSLTIVEGLAFDDDVAALRRGEEYIDGANHCWVKHNRIFIDLTATQFDSNVKKVHIVDTDDEEYWGLFYGNRAKNNMMNDWPDCQSPYSYLPELRKRAKKIAAKLA